MRRPKLPLAATFSLALLSLALPAALAAPKAEWMLARGSEAYGLVLPEELPAKVEGPLSFSISAKPEAELWVQIKSPDGSASYPELATAKRSGASWLVELGFPGSGKYLIAVYGKPSAEGKSYYGLATAEIDYETDDSSPWSFSPAFARLRLSVGEGPAKAASESASAFVAGPAEVALAYRLRRTDARGGDSGGSDVNGGVSIDREGKGWRIDVDFPEAGDYALILYGSKGGESVAMARLRLKSKVGSSPNDRLARAMRFKDLEGMRAALAAKADPNELVRAYRSYSMEGKKVEVSGSPILALLAWYNAGEAQEAALRLLKSSGADFRASTSEGLAPIVESFATAYLRKPDDELKLVKLLLALGADPNQGSDYVHILDGKPVADSLPAQLMLERYGYKKARDFAPILPLLFAAGANPKARWPSGKTGLGELLGGCDEEKTPYLVAYLDAGLSPGPDDLRDLAYSLLYGGFKGGDALLARVLASAESLDALDGAGTAFLHSIVGSSSSTRLSTADLARILDMAKDCGADFNRSDAFGKTPLMSATDECNYGAVDELISRGADPKRKGSDGRTPLFYLRNETDQKTLEAMIDRFLALGVDINARDSSGKTAFHFLVHKGPAFLKYLVSKGADPAIPDMDGFTAYGLAKSSEFKESAAYLASLKVPANSGGWPVGNDSPPCKAVLAADYAAIAALPAASFSEMCARTRDGVPSTPLHLAAEVGDPKLIAALAARKVDWGAGDRYGRGPLELAVLAGKADAVRALLAAGADPNAADDRAETPLSRAVAARSPMAKLMLDAGAKPDWKKVAVAAAVSATPAEAARLSGGEWGGTAAEALGNLGRTDLVAAFGPTIRRESGDLKGLAQAAKESEAVFAAYEAEAVKPLAARPAKAGERDRAGSYSLALDAWSPWIKVDPAIDLKKYPVAVYVPKEYDGSKPYGLVISMMNAKGSSQFPKPEYLASLSARRLLYVGFDPYNGIFDAGNWSTASENHERLVLAAVYHMLGAYSVDRSRVYLTGFSWGGRLTGEIVPLWPNIFTGGIAVGGCFTSGFRVVKGYRYARDRATIVCATGDWDYNRQETFNGYDTFASLGYEAYYIQEPMKAHARISGECFEKALGFLDAAAARRAAAKK